MNSLSPFEPRPDQLSTQRMMGQSSSPAFSQAAVYPKDVDSGSFRRILRRWPIALIVSILFAALTLAYCLVAKKVYESTAEVLLQSPGQQPSLEAESQLASLAGLAGMGSTAGDIPTQIEIMTSDEAIRDIANRVGTNPDPIKTRPLITIAPHKTSSQIVVVSFRDGSPARAQAAVRAMVDVYNEHMGHESSTVTGRMILTTKEQIISISAKLAHSEQALANYSRAVGTVDPEADAVQRVEQIYIIRKEQLDTQRDLSGQQTQFEDYKQDVTTLEPSIVPSLSLTPSPLIQSDEVKLSDLEELRSKLAAQYTPEDDEMKQNQQQIDSVRGDIRDEMQREAKTTPSTIGTLNKSGQTQGMSGGGNGYIVGELTRGVNPVRETAKQKMVDAQAQMLADNAQLSVINRAIASADTDMASAPDKMRRLGDLKNDSLVYQKLYDDLQAQLVQLNARLPGDETYATMLQTPTFPKSPVSPRPILYTVAAGVLGLLIGVMVLFVFDSADPRVRDPADIALLADLPVLQSLPYHPRDGMSPQVEQLSRRSYQRLASTLSYLGLGTKITTLMLTSASSDEGSSTVAAKLAAALAQAGRRVILVDATGPQPRIIPLSGPPMVEYAPDSANGSSADSNIVVKTAANSAVNISTLLVSSDAEDLVQQLKLHADVVIFDAPAVFEGINSAVLAEQVDAVLYVSKLDGLTREEVRQALGLILSGSASVMGVVLNDTRL